MVALAFGAVSGPAAAAPLAPQIHTVAGGGGCSGGVLAMSSGGACDGVGATSVPIVDARSVSPLPGGGFVYVDQTDDLVREVSSSGTVSTVAGMANPTTGAVDTNDTDGVAAAASGLDDPVGVAALRDGGFLITEYAGSRVRMVSPGPPGTAQITTIAGIAPGGNSPAGYNGLSGPPTQIQLNYPTDAEVTAGGQVLIADSGNNLIREVFNPGAPNASLTTVAGVAPGGAGCADTTTACEGAPADTVQLDEPDSVSPIAGGAGGFLIAEATANAIRQVSAAGEFTTVAGVPEQAGGYAGDGGPATAAQLNFPEQVASLPEGGFLIADAHNDVIRQVSATGTISTVAGDNTATYAGDGGDATAASLDNPAGVAPYPTSDGDFLIADEDNGAIREVTIPSVSSFTVGPASALGANGWYVNPPATVVVAATEGAKINCELDPPQAPPAFAAIPAGCAFTGSGGPVTANGVNTLYAASANKAGDDENPVSVTIDIDTSTPTMTCVSVPAFGLGARHAQVSATVADSVSGPVTPLVRTGVSRSQAGPHTATLSGSNMAGTTSYAYCPYTVAPLTMKPAPAVRATFTPSHRATTITALAIGPLTAGSEVDLVCRGGGCPFTKADNVTGTRCKNLPCRGKARTTPKARRRLVVTPLFTGARLTSGSRLTVTVTRRNAIAHVWIYTFRAGRSPSLRTSCEEPWLSVIGKGCEAPVTHA